MEALSVGKESVSENLGKVPKVLRHELYEFLSNEKTVKQLKQMLIGTGLILEKDDFQIPIHSTEELLAIQAYLTSTLSSE